MQIVAVSAESEFGAVDVDEIMRVAEEGVLRPLMCKGTDGQIYFVKPSNCGGWPLCLEWICARLGRSLGLQVPNYRQVLISPELASAWNETGHKAFVEAGIGFGSQLVPNPAEIDAAKINTLALEMRREIIWFDWWIRNGDRRKGNPNLVWSPNENTGFLIDHEKAGDSRNQDAFWRDHILAQDRGLPPLSFIAKMLVTLPRHNEIRSELPPAWTTNQKGLDWFFAHLKNSLSGPQFGDWIEHSDE